MARNTPERHRTGTCSVCFEKLHPSEQAYIRYEIARPTLDDEPHWINTHYSTTVCVWCITGRDDVLKVLEENLPQHWRDAIRQRWRPGGVLVLEGSADSVHSAVEECEPAWAAMVMFLILTRNRQPSVASIDRLISSNAEIASVTSGGCINDIYG